MPKGEKGAAPTMEAQVGTRLTCVTFGLNCIKTAGDWLKNRQCKGRRASRRLADRTTAATEGMLDVNPTG